MKYKVMLNDKPPEERLIAGQQLQQMVRLAESAECRRAALLRYFGETFAEGNCGGCDNCSSPREQYDGTIDAQKFLSCVYRLKEKSGFPFGLAHTSEVLVGSRNDKVLKFGHDAVSTFGKGAEHSREEWKRIGRELIGMGLLQEQPDRMNSVEVTPEGFAALKRRDKIRLSRAASSPGEAEASESSSRRERSSRPKAPGRDLPFDEELFEHLRGIRRQLAVDRDVPPYVILSDVSLRQMSREYPVTPAALSRTSGIGEKKLEDFGDLFIREIETYLAAHPRQSFEAPSPAPMPPVRSSETIFESVRRFRAGESLDQIAAARGLARGTIVAHLVDAIRGGEPLDISPAVPSSSQSEIAAAFEKIGFANLTGVKELLGHRYDYEALHLVRARFQSRPG
jgi:ATP-dependent DNA helicase RecQ